MRTQRKEALSFGVIICITLTATIVSGATSTGSSISIMTNGNVLYLPSIDVTIDTNNVILSNKLSLGFMLSFEAATWRDSPILRQLASNADFTLVRLIDSQMKPCTYWNESTKTGTFDWTGLDPLINRIFQIGAQPLIALGYSNGVAGLIIPKGMAIDPSTGLPYPNSWAMYSSEWVKHFKSLNLPVRFYEIINEPWSYFGWNNYTRISYYMNLFNTSAQAMRTQNPNVLLGFDGSNRKPVLDYWLSNGGADLDFISFHKYDSGNINQYADDVMLQRAETFQLKTDSFYYGVADSQRVYYNARHKLIPVINSESNFDSAYATGTDPKIQQMIGAVWTALVLRTGVVEGLNYNVYQCFADSASWERTNLPSGGVGFALINTDNNQPWYPYYVNWMFGTSLGISDPILESSSSNDSIRTLAWIHDGKEYLILISKSNQTFDVFLHGLPAQMNLTKIDNAVSWENPRIQSSIVNLTAPLTINGYTVLRLESL